MDKTYQHQDVEEIIYKNWESRGYFAPKIDSSKKPFSIILPPPNANAPLHFGHAMYVIEDILIRYHRMKGDSALWVPGADHAGFETQYVFEKELKKEGKSRLDFERKVLYDLIWNYVQLNRKKMENQLRKLGFSLDWSRNKFTLDPDVVKIVYKTFKKLYDDGLIYRGDRLVNYCTHCGTSFSDLEVNHIEQKDPLYFIKYGPLIIATVRPETKFGDTAVAVNPDDKRYKNLIGQEIEVKTLLGKVKMKVIADQLIDPKFGTGAAKVTPAHDMKDFEIGKRHNLSVVRVIDFNGRLNDKAGKYKGLRVREARKIIADEMIKEGLIEKIDADYTHTIEVCYKCGTTIEPMLLPQWFVKMETLAKPAIDAVKKGQIKIFPKRFESQYLFFLENIRDWNISRQVVWGIQIPAWFREWKPDESLYVMGFHERTEDQILSGKTKTYRLRDHGLKVGDKFILENSQAKKVIGYGTVQKIEIKKLEKIPLDDNAHGATYKTMEELINAFKFHHPDTNVDSDTSVWIYTYSFGVLKNGRVEEIYMGENKPEGGEWRHDPDTFDTWFSSSQWPFAALMTAQKGDYETFYPTSVLETGYDILPWWVARMVMMGIYTTGKIPFENVVLHGLVKDPLGKKMSKSKGNVVDPLELVEEYGADAVRFALMYGTGLGNDQSLSYPKLISARKFTNKIWNMGRFIQMKRPEEFKDLSLPLGSSIKDLEKLAKSKEDKQMAVKVVGLVNEVTKDIEGYSFNFAVEKLYEFAWHEFADKYIEEIKNRINENSYMMLVSFYQIILKLLHPFMPFVTEEIYQRFNFGESVMVESWPKYD